MSPVRAESRQLLESPRRQLRSVCKTPYRVLDAPELADDFYLNLVDWSSTNVLGVGLGSCVYLWTAHNAQVSKLCDLAESSDTISSVSWVQKVCFSSFVCVPALHSNLIMLNFSGYDPCCGHTFGPTTYLRCKHITTPTNLSTCASATDRSSSMELVGAVFWFARPYGTPSRCPRSIPPTF